MRRPLMAKVVQIGLVAAATVSGVSAWGNCACFCVEGQLTTLCTEVDEAQGHPNLCPASSSASCPQNFSNEGKGSYDAPNDSAQNCRDVNVYDAIQGKYVTAKACDVI